MIFYGKQNLRETEKQSRIIINIPTFVKLDSSDQIVIISLKIFKVLTILR